MNKPNIIFLFADQLRAQALGYAGDPNVKTSYLDKLAAESINMTNAVSNCPICTPYRASLLSGQNPLTHGLFMNDLCLPDNGNSLAQVLGRNGYDTAYIGKWHLDGHGRSSYIPPERRQGFDYWKVLECTHDYNESYYYDNDGMKKKKWDGYDAFAQTDDAVNYLHSRREREDPFILMVSYGTPHNPYETAPEEFQKLYDPDKLILRENVPPSLEEKARKDLVGYYAHITALDTCVEKIDRTLEELNLKENTLFIFTSDHGDSMESNCDPAIPGVNKQRPYDESVMVPLLIRGPGLKPRDETLLIGSPDLMPTLLGFCGVEIPETVEGLNYTPCLTGQEPLERECILIAGYSPFADWRKERGGREFRGIRTKQYTYVRDLNGPWLLYDNRNDPFQKQNLVNKDEMLSEQDRLDRLLEKELKNQKDSFLPAQALRKRWGYTVDKVDAIPFQW
jgi:arylsulfatase A-like enzyme